MKSFHITLLLLISVCCMAQVPVVSTLEELDRTPPSKTQPKIDVLGFSKIGQIGWPKSFWYDPANSLPTNAIIRLVPGGKPGRRIHDWNGDPTAFGADTTGQIDSTIALSNACAFAQTYATELVLPPGRFLVDSTDGPVFWIRTNGFKIRGAGKDVTRIIDVGTGTVALIGEDGQFSQRNILRDFGIVGTNSAALVKTSVWSCYNVLQNLYLQGGTRALDANNWSWGYDVEDVDIFNAQTGIYHAYSNPHWNYRAVKVRYCGTGLFFTNRVAAFYVDDQTWTGGNISHNTNGIVAYGSRWIRFNDVYFEENGSANNQESSIQLNSLSRAFVFKNPRFVSQRGHGFSVSGIGHEIYNASFTTIPTNRYGIHVTTGGSNTRIITEADGPWAKGSGASITAAFGGTSGTNGTLQQSDLTLVSGGSGYSTNVKVYIIGSGATASGATASLQVSDAGVITNFTLIQGGLGYTNAPTISIYDWDNYLWDQGNKSQVNWLTIDRASKSGEAPTTIQQAGFVLNNSDKTIWYVDRNGGSERVGGRPWFNYDGSDQYGTIRFYSQDGTTRWSSIGASANQLNFQPGATSADAWQITTSGIQPVSDNTKIIGTDARRISGFTGTTLTLYGRAVFRELTNPPTPATNTFIIYASDNGSGKTQVVVRYSDGSTNVLDTMP